MISRASRWHLVFMEVSHSPLIHAGKLYLGTTSMVPVVFPGEKFVYVARSSLSVVAAYLFVLSPSAAVHSTCLYPLYLLQDP